MKNDCLRYTQYQEDLLDNLKINAKILQGQITMVMVRTYD